MSRNIMLTIAYDGSRYRGWQVQPNGITVQQCVETAIKKLTGETLRVYCAGRTDSGVHAIGQVASFYTDSNIPAHKFRLGLRRFLPDDISVIRSQHVSDDFHATFSAIRKRYRYLIFDGPTASPFLNKRVCHSRQVLCVSSMRESLKHLLGTHDFRCFETQWPNKATSIRTVLDATIQRQPHWSLWTSESGWNPTDQRPHEDPNSPLICFEIMADGFLYNMVRAIVGTLFEIGTTRKSPEFMRTVVESMDRATAGSTAVPDGLYLLHVDYPQEHLDVSEG